MEVVFQAAKINKPLPSVSKLIDSDMRVGFDRERSYIYIYIYIYIYVYNETTGDIIRIKRERGVFVLEAFTHHDPAKSADTRSGFTRHD